MEFEDVIQSVDSWVGEGIVPGVSIAVEHHGKLVAEHHTGNAAPDRPVTAETLFALASVSKPFSAAAVMGVIDQGFFSLDDEVASILPTFSETDDPFAEDAFPPLEAQRDDITFRQLLAHISGAPENAGIKRIRPTTLPTMNEQVEIMMHVPLKSAPGEILRYSNLGPAIAAHAAEVATGIPFHQLLQHTILDVMGLASIALTPDASLDDRIAIVQAPSNEGTPAESYNSRYWRENGITWGGYFGTAREVLRFATSFLPNRDNPLSHESVLAMTTDQVHGAEGGVESLGVIWNPGFWGAGWEVKGTKRRHWTGETSSADTWCHWGQAGTLVWVDPTRELGVAVLANRTVRTPWPLRPARWTGLSDAIIEVADRKG